MELSLHGIKISNVPLINRRTMHYLSIKLQADSQRGTAELTTLVENGGRVV